MIIKPVSWLERHAKKKNLNNKSFTGLISDFLWLFTSILGCFYEYISLMLLGGQTHTSVWIGSHLWFPCCGAAMITRQQWQPESTFMLLTLKVKVLCMFPCLFHIFWWDVREPLMWSEIWKEKAGGCVAEAFEGKQICLFMWLANSKDKTV